MVTTPLPNLGSDLGDSGSDSELSDSSSIMDYYVVRITPCEKFTSEKLLAFLKTEVQVARFVVGRETVPQEHFHLVLGVDPSISE